MMTSIFKIGLLSYAYEFIIHKYKIMGKLNKLDFDIGMY